MLDRILIAVDGTEPATNAVHHGVSIGAAVDAHVEIVHVIEEPAIDRPRSGDSPHERGEAILEAATGVAGEYGISADTHLLEGGPPQAIARHAADHDADLIAMGRHGRSGASERLLGTVTDRVLRSADRPVLAVGAADTPTTYRGVLVPTDGSDAAERALPHGETVAAAFDAELHVISVADVAAAAGVFDAGGVSQEFIDRVTAQRREAVDRLAGQVDATHSVTTTVVRGTPHEAIGAYAGDNAVDLFVMGSTGASNLTGQTLGSVANRVLRSVQQPVLVVPT